MIKIRNSVPERKKAATRYHFTRILILRIFYIVKWAGQRQSAINNLYLNIVFIQMKFICSLHHRINFFFSLRAFFYCHFVVDHFMLSFDFFSRVSLYTRPNPTLLVIRWLISFCFVLNSIESLWFGSQWANVWLRARTRTTILLSLLCIANVMYLFQRGERIVRSIWKRAARIMLPKRKEENNELKPHIITNINT